MSRALFFRRESIKQNCLTGGLESTAREPLHDAKENELIQAGGGAAQKGAKCEEGDRAEEIVSPSKSRAEPAGNRQDDRIGREVTGDDPLAVSGGGGEPARDVT